MIDTTALFLHVLAAAGMVAGGVTQIQAGARLRAAEAAREIVTWARFARTAGWVILVSAAVSLFTGGHLAGAVWTTDARSGFSYPFITLGAAGLLLLAPVGPMVGGAQLRRIIEAAQPVEDGVASHDLVAAARAPRLWGPIHSLVGVSIALIALMVYKPGWVAGAALVFVGFGLGWLSGHAVARRP